MADRPIQLSDVLERSQCMAASMAANKLLNEVLAEMGASTHSRLVDAIEAAFSMGILSRGERHDLRRLNQMANVAKHDVR